MRQVFQQIPWFYPEDPSELKELYYKYGTPRIMKKGEVIKSSGEGRRLFHLISGLCTYYVQYREGAPRGIAVILPDRSMCDVTAITRDVVNVTTVALRESKILSIPPEVLKSALADTKLSDIVCRHLLYKQESIIEATIANLTNPPQERMITFFSAAVKALKSDCVKGYYNFPLDLSNEDIARFLSITRVSVSRILAKWQHDGLLEKHGRKIKINKMLFDNLYDWVAFL